MQAHATYGFIGIPFIAVPGGVAESQAPVALNSLSTAPSLNATQVQDQKGHLLGQAERIQTDQDGKPAALAFRTASSAESAAWTCGNSSRFGFAAGS